MTDAHDGGEALIAGLEAAGADYIFCSPGSEWAPVWEALARRHRDGVPTPRYLDLTHETVAVGMATGYALVTRRGQGVLLHAGAGLLQGACAIHGALLAGAPMVVASAESTTYGEGTGPDPGGQWYRNLSVVGGPHAMAAPFVKWANQVGSVDTLHQMVARGMEMASRAPAGPVYLNVPVEVLLSPWADPGLPATAAPGGTVSAPADIARVHELIDASERPVIVTETVGRDADGLAALTAFAEAYDIPVVEPAAAVCTNFPRDHRLHVGDDVSPFVDSADLILLISCRAPFYPPSRRPEAAPVVVVDETPHRAHMVYQVLHATAYLEGGVPATLRALTAAGAADGGAARARAGWATRWRAAEVEAATAAEDRARHDEGIDPVLLVTALRDVIGGTDPVVVDETITHGRLIRRHLRRTTPDSYAYVQGGLGQGTAVALGVKLAVGDRPVVLTIGDGSFLYNPIVQALDASRAYDLPLLVVVVNNHEYRSMKLNHLRAYPDGVAVETGEFLGVDLSGQPELSRLAAVFDMHGESVTDPADLAPALERAMKAVADGVTAIVNVSVSR